MLVFLQTGERFERLNSIEWRDSRLSECKGRLGMTQWHIHKKSSQLIPNRNRAFIAKMNEGMGRYDVHI
jgi:hypothetical protein